MVGHLESLSFHVEHFRDRAHRGDRRAQGILTAWRATPEGAAFYAREEATRARLEREEAALRARRDLQPVDKRGAVPVGQGLARVRAAKKAA